jgi:SAM-dependent methyltransferase
MAQITTSAARGAAVYSPFTLAVYDVFVLGLSNSFAWRCPTKRVLLPFYKQAIGKRHLDIGPGTGYYLEKANIPSTTQITLLDLNPHSLTCAAQRLGRSDAKTLQADVTQPISLDGPYDSISIFFVIHCLPGPLERKAPMFTNLRPHLAKNGTIYGATVLGKGVEHNSFGKILMNM